MRRCLVCLLGILFVAPLWTLPVAAANADEVALRKLYVDYDATWNKGDAKGMAMFWAADAVHVEPNGSVVNGRAALEKSLAERFAATLKGTHSQQTVETIQFIKPDVAVVDAAYEVTGAHSADGKELPTLRGRYVDIWLKQAGTWRIVADRPLAAPPAAK